jgi:acetyltransferase
LKARPDCTELLKKVRNEGRSRLLETEAKALLHAHGAPVTEDRLAGTADEAAQAAEALNTDVVMKIVSPDILHKSDAGGVRLHLRGEKPVRQAFKEIIENAERFKPGADIRGVLVAPMVEPGVEVIIGTKVDDQFGPVIMFGLGGVMVEILKDVSFRVIPLTPTAAKTMIRDIRAYPILRGTRGMPPRDEKALRKLLMTCSEIIESYPEILEMDLNPVVAHENGLSVVDARMILKEP